MGTIVTTFPRVKKSPRRVVRAVAILALSIFFTMVQAANHYDPRWGPAPPAPPHGMQPLPSQRVVEHMIFPLIGEFHFSDDYTADRGGFLHSAIDIKAAKMTPIVAPISGTLGMKDESFWIYGDDGWIMLGTHLNNDDPGTHDKIGGKDVMFAPNLVGNQHVKAGQFIGYVGMSGNATGPHLHFELYAPGNGSTVPRVRNPFLSLKCAQVLSEPRVRLTGPRPKAGELRFDGCLRKIEKGKRKVTLLLTNKMTSNGHVSTVFGPHYMTFDISRTVLDQIGRWRTLDSVRNSKPVTFMVPAANQLTNVRVDGIWIPSRR